MRTLKVEKTVEVEVSSEDLTDEQILSELQERGIGPPEKDTSDFSDEEIQEEFRNRFGGEATSIERVYEEFRHRGDAPQCLRDYIYAEIGRILP
jgi:hypothetical protein